MKTLLLDIDYTLVDGNTPRPFLKEFMEEMAQKYNVYFYTAGTRQRVVDMGRILASLGFDYAFIHKIQRKSLTRENCPMINYTKPSGTTIEIKCLHKAAAFLRVDVKDIILLDDNPSFDHPQVDQVIQAPGFMDYMVDDNYLTRTGL